MFYRKKKLARLSQKSFTLVLDVLFYAFLRTFFKTIGEPLHLLTVHPKLIFRGALKKALIIPGEGSYQAKYFSEIFPSTLALMLQIHFYLCFLGSSLECALNSHSCQKCKFSAPENAPETTLETTFFALFLQNVTKHLEKKLVIKFVLMEYINFTNISFFCILYILLLGKTPQPCMAGKKLCL